ncbi:hypothetical protein GGS20DRAFT_251971 [Poronia punctata]|nr:hypothetical protein GGS20DRAFT_251971 [Poronia punctata]
MTGRVPQKLLRSRYFVGRFYLPMTSLESECSQIPEMTLVVLVTFGVSRYMYASGTSTLSLPSLVYLVQVLPACMVHSPPGQKTREALQSENTPTTHTIPHRIGKSRRASKYQFSPIDPASQNNAGRGNRHKVQIVSYFVVLCHLFSSLTLATSISPIRRN